MRGGDKPLDRGTGVVCASFGAQGEWLSLGRAHPAEGFIELSGAPPFDERLRGRPADVRRYRALLANESSSFLWLEGLGDGVTLSVEVGGAPGSESLEQQLVAHWTGAGSRPAALRLRFRGRLDRPALAMITEAGSGSVRPLEPNLLAADGGELRVRAAGLSAEAVMRVQARGIPPATWRLSGDGAEMPLEWPAGESEFRLDISCSLRVAGTAPAARRPTAGEQKHALPLAAGLLVPATLRAELRRIGDRALAYVTQCTALQVAPGRLAILTDHRLLPLSWTRDAYFQALLLLRAGRSELVEDHLRWLWLDCHRPTATWARSHHADGRRKDEVYQADQQLYPLLELADFWRTAGRLPTLGNGSGDHQTWSGLAADVLDDLLARLAEHELLPTDENAADDPAGLPFVLANQILAWHTLTRLGELAEVLRLPHGLDKAARRLAAATRRHFTLLGPAGHLWAYAVDGKGGSELYHDANDVPTAFAALWGFCSADDADWRGTMDFAFGPANPAYAAGPLGGLGSRHTPGVWSLGLIQQWVVHSLTGEKAAAEAVVRRLVDCAMSDGSLPEASDSHTGRLLARPWFAWPGALLGALLPADDSQATPVPAG
ncbi:MAG TPA: glycoside hydrolase family 125 protein [Candidatus Limnocylindria bacterium]|nr:glycoside hydrolase family 125 protein [Candidatus Limnocylindria bacterium]